jgi:hypothetical protein
MLGPSERNPWYRPPLARQGNRSDRVLFESIGRTLNAWEQIESELAHLYSAFLTGDRFDMSANLAYGEPNTIPLRLAKLHRVAKPHWVQHPSQEIEAEFERLSDLVDRYSARRNDIAHGIARPFQWIVTPNLEGLVMISSRHSAWCVIPPHYRPKTEPGAYPAYLLTSREINAFGAVFLKVTHALSNLSLWVIQHVPVPLGDIRPVPGSLPYLVPVPRILRGQRRPYQSILE